MKTKGSTAESVPSCFEHNSGTARGIHGADRRPFELAIRDYIPSSKTFPGIDLKGGVYVVMEASDKDEDGNPIKRRLRGFLKRHDKHAHQPPRGKSYTEATVVKQGANRIS